MLKSINRQNTWFSSIFLVYMLGNHSIIVRKCTTGWQGCKIFLTHLRRLPHLTGVPHLHMNKPLGYSTYEAICRSHVSPQLVAQNQIRLNMCNLLRGQNSIAETKIFIKSFSTLEANCPCSLSRNLSPDQQTRSDSSRDVLQRHVVQSVRTLTINNATVRCLAMGNCTYSRASCTEQRVVLSAPVLSNSSKFSRAIPTHSVLLRKEHTFDAL